MKVSIAGIDKWAHVNFDTMNVLEIPVPPIPRCIDAKREEVDLHVSEASEPLFRGKEADAERFVLVTYDEQTAEAEGYLFDPSELRNPPVSFGLDDVTAGGAVRVAIAWAKEQQARYVVRFIFGRKSVAGSLRLYDITDA